MNCLPAKTIYFGYELYNLEIDCKPNLGKQNFDTQNLALSKNENPS
jgi:hypothetical protein